MKRDMQEDLVSLVAEFDDVDEKILRKQSRPLAGGERKVLEDIFGRSVNYSKSKLEEDTLF